MGGGSSKNRVMPSSQQVLDWRAKLEMKKSDAKGKAESLKRELDGLAGVQEALARAEAEAKALQAELEAARRLAAEASERKREAEKAKADADSLATQAQQADKDRLKIVDEIEALPSREELVKKVQQANEAAESAQAQLDDARRLAAEASEKNSAMVKRKAEAEEALAGADRDKEEAERLLAEAEKAEKDRLRIVEEIEAMPSREEIIKTMKEANEAAESAQAQLDDARRLAAEASDKNSAMVKRKAEAEEALAKAIQDRAEAESLLATSMAEAEQAEKDRLKIVEEIEAMPSREELVKKASEAKGRLDEILELKSQADALVAGAAEASKREGEAMAELWQLMKKIQYAKRRKLEKVTLRRVFKDHAEQVEGVVFLPGNAAAANSGSESSDASGYILVSADDYKVRVWDVQTGKTQKIFKGHDTWIYTISLGPDTLYATSSGDKTVRVCNSKNGETKHVLEGHTEQVYTALFSPDGSILASGSGDNTVRIWNVRTGSTEKICRGHTNHVWSLAFSPDGSILASASWDRTVRLWNAESWEIKHILEGHTNVVMSVKYSPDGSLLVSGSKDRTVRVWDAQSGEAKHTLTGHNGEIIAVEYSRDGSVLASGGGPEDKTIHLWDTETWEITHVLQGHSNRVTDFSFSPDGSLLASSSRDGTVRVWDLTWSKEALSVSGKACDDDDEVVAGPSLPQGVAQGTMDACLWTAVSAGNTERRRLELVSFCLRNGANPFAPMASGAWPAARLKQGFTLLHCAAFAGDRDAIRVLIKDSGSVERGLTLASAKTRAKDGSASRGHKGGKTAEEIADMMGHAEAAAEIRAMVQKLQSSVDMKLETLAKNKEAMLKEYEATVLGDAEAGRPDPGRNGATLLLSVDEHRLVALAMHEFAVELITDAADASEGGIVRRTESIARSGSAGGAVQGAAAERAYHLNLKYGVETKDMITGQFVDAAAGLSELIQVDDDELSDLTKGGIARIEEEVGNLGDEDAVLDLNYILKEKTSEKKYDNGVRDEGRQGMTLADFLSLPECLEAKLKEVEVAALRFYSSKSFSHVTAPIRDLTRRDRGEMVPLPATTIHVVNGLRKLRRVGAKNSDAVIEKIFFRGMKNLKMTDEFARVGGTELAPMSTTSELAIAVRYGMSRNSLIFRIVTMNNLQRGSDISHISVFPTESEVLFAPLTFLQPTGRSQILKLGGITVTVVEVTPTSS